jgi:prefoldin subunit 5
MDNHQTIQSQKKLLQDTKVKLEREIDTLYKEIDHVEQDAFGVMNKVKMLVAAQVGRGAGMEAVMGEAYSRAKRGGFKDAHDYIDHLKESIEEARNAISKINEIIPNLDAIARDQSSLDSRLDTWVQKTQDLFN